MTAFVHLKGEDKRPPVSKEKSGLFFWYPRAESNRQRCFRRALLYPFNYGDILSCAKSQKLNGFVGHVLS